MGDPNYGLHPDGLVIASIAYMNESGSDAQKVKAAIAAYLWAMEVGTQGFRFDDWLEKRDELLHRYEEEGCP